MSHESFSEFENPDQKKEELKNENKPENLEEKILENAGGSEEFTREVEKKHRQEIRKILNTQISEVLKDFGFKKTGYSLWSHKVEDSWHIVYLQRSQFSHQYYIEAGICDEKDLPSGEKLDIVFCKKRQRIEGIIIDNEEKKQTQGAKRDEKETKKKVNDVVDALTFYAPDKQENFISSISSEEAKQKIEVIQNIIREYIPHWFQTGGQTWPILR